MENKKIKVEGNIKVAGIYGLCNKDGIVRYVGSGIECGDCYSRHQYNVARGYYMDTNKRLLQEAFDREDLVMKIIHESASNADVRNMSEKQKESLQIALGVLEEFYINLNRKTICNRDNKVTKSSSSPSIETTEKRRIANKGEKNPNNKYSERLIKWIVWFKEQGYKPKRISGILKGHGIDIDKNYIGLIKVSKWIYIIGEKPTWFKDGEQ